MKSFRKCRQAALSLFLALCLFLGAGGTLTGGRNAYAASGVHMNQTSLKLSVGDTYKLIILRNSDFSSYRGKVKWSSSRSSVARVSSSGMVTAVSAGSAVITAKVGSSRIKCKVTVKKAESSAAKKIRQLGKAIVQRGEKNKNDQYFVNGSAKGATFAVIYENQKRIRYAMSYQEDDFYIFMYMYHNPSSPEKVIMKGVFYYKEQLFGKTIATVKTSQVNNNSKKSLGFHVQAGTYKDDKIKRIIVQWSESFTDLSLPYWNSLVKSVSGMTMKDFGFRSL